MKKMSVNIHDFANNKSILPGEDSVFIMIFREKL